MIGNCLIMAFILKLKSPKNRRIIKIPRQVVGSKVFPHFVVWDKTDDKVYHFERLKDSKLPPILFKGEFHSYSKQNFDFMVHKKIQKFLSTAEKSLYTKTFNSFNDVFNTWFSVDDKKPSIAEGEPFTKKVPYVLVSSFDSDGLPVTKVLKIEDGMKLSDDDTWKYITPSDSAYWSLVNLKT